MSTPMDEWRLMLHPDLPGFRQMAIDEVLLMGASPGTKPVLRFYTWERPTLSLGFFQDYKSVVQEAFCVHNNIDVVRRITGGRAVLHHLEVTYTVVAPYEGPFAGRSLKETYRLIAGALEEGLQLLGFPEAEVMADAKAPAGAIRPSQCFVRTSRYEITGGNKKVIGSAQKRSRSGFLQHGSILLGWDSRLQQGCVLRPDPGIEERIAPLDHVLGRHPSFEEVVSSFSTAFSRKFHLNLIPEDPSPEEWERIRKMEQKYLNENWTRKECR